MNKQPNMILKVLAAILLAGAALPTYAVGEKTYLVPSPRGSGYTAVGGSGSCATVEYSGEKGTNSFHLESIINRACKAGETDGHRDYTQVNPRGFMTGGMSRNQK